jgi:uncharacterized protein with HEPN domain
MREPSRDKGRLEDMVSYSDNVINFIEGKTFEEFISDKILYFAVLKNVEIIGEAAYMLSLSFKENHPELPWNEIIAMRHVLVHGYSNISDRNLWITATEDIIPLKTQVEEYLKDM